MASANSDVEVCYQVAAEFVGEEKVRMRKTDNRKSAQKSRQARYRRRVERREEAERLSRQAKEIDVYHRQWMDYKEALKRQVLEKEREWQKYVVMRVKLTTSAREGEEVGEMV